MLTRPRSHELALECSLAVGPELGGSLQHRECDRQRGCGGLSAAHIPRSPYFVLNQHAARLATSIYLYIDSSYIESPSRWPIW